MHHRHLTTQLYLHYLPQFPDHIVWPFTGRVIPALPGARTWGCRLCVHFSLNFFYNYCYNYFSYFSLVMNLTTNTVRWHDSINCFIFFTFLSVLIIGDLMVRSRSLSLSVFLWWFFSLSHSRFFFFWGYKESLVIKRVLHFKKISKYFIAKMMLGSYFLFKMVCEKTWYSICTPTRVHRDTSNFISRNKLVSYFDLKLFSKDKFSFQRFRI